MLYIIEKFIELKKFFEPCSHIFTTFAIFFASLWCKMRPHPISYTYVYASKSLI